MLSQCTVSLQPKTLFDLEQACRQEMANNGIPFTGEFKHNQEKFHRFSQKSNGDKDEFCAPKSWEFKGQLYFTCYYGTWRGGLTEYFYKSYGDESNISREDRKQFDEEIKKRNQEFQKFKKIEEENRLKRARDIWSSASSKASQPEHSSYLEYKKVQSHGLRYGEDDYKSPVVIIPIRDLEGELRAIQRIYVDGKKRIHGLKTGNFHLIGEIKSDSLIRISEGYATGASIHECCGDPTVIAFDCGNLEAVLGQIRKKYPTNQVVICADNDIETEGNPGLTAAEKAAKKHNAKVITPTFPTDYRLNNGEGPTDFNDLLAGFGDEELKKQLTIKKNHLVPVDILTFLSMDLPPRRLILSPWLPEQGLAMIHAKRGIGKTFVALTVAYAIATGGRAFKWEAQEPRKVLYIDGEMPARTMQERLAKIAKAADKEPPSPEYFKLITPDLHPKGIRDLASLLGQQDIDDYLSDFDVVFLDNLSTLVRNGAENDAESWVTVQEWLLNLRRLGKSVVMIHHSGKSGNQRGTSKREDILDTVITLRQPKDADSTDGAKFEIHFEKARGFTDEDAKAFSVQLISNEKEGMKWNIAEIETLDFDKVIELINEGMSQRDVAAEIGKSAAYVNKLVKKAKAEGLINEK